MQIDRFFLLEQPQTNRTDWEFEYTGAAVLKGAQDQLAYRQGRLALWEQKKAELIEKIKASGLVMTESVSEKMANYTAAVRGRASVKLDIDPAMQADLDEILAKIDTHRGLAASYEAWVQVLTANPHQVLRLKHGDWMFFFGKA